jgi:predicted Fe-Mo cluster-binding NifX family protein
MSHVIVDNTVQQSLTDEYSIGTQLAIVSQTKIMIVAVPKFGESVAPCFEAAKYFVMARLEGAQVSEQTIKKCSGCEGFGRVQLMRDKRVDVLICNGIKGFYRDLLRASGVKVLANVSGEIGTALEHLAAGELMPEAADEEPVVDADAIPLDDLVCWTRELFLAHGYDVRPGENLAPFPIDLVAEIQCPICQKPVRVAICCGAHTYRSTDEIRRLHQVASSGYNARVYIHSATPKIEQCCREYGIELVDPDGEFAAEDDPAQDNVPILQGAIEGHEQMSGRT